MSWGAKGEDPMDAETLPPVTVEETDDICPNGSFLGR